MISEVSASSQDKPTQRPTQDVSDAVLLNCGSCQISGASLFNSNVVTFATWGGEGQNMASKIVSPEKPVAFPDKFVPTWSRAEFEGAHGPWPRSLVLLFKSFRVADHVLHRVLANTTPKLLSTLLRIFHAIDALLSACTLQTCIPEEPQGWALERSTWEDSARCGMQAIRCDSNFHIFSGIDVNRFWTDLAGLHREEFGSRCFSGDQLLSTTELRQTRKLLNNFVAVVRGRVQAKQTAAKTSLEMKASYVHFSRNWGRGEDAPHRGRGALLRMKIRWTLDPQNWMYVVRLHHAPRALCQRVLFESLEVPSRRLRVFLSS